MDSVRAHGTSPNYDHRGRIGEKSHFSNARVRPPEGDGAKLPFRMSREHSTSIGLGERSLLSLAWPVSLTMTVGIAQPMLDSWFLARVSDSAAAGVGAMVPVFAATMILLNTFGQAGASVAGQLLGARRPRHARATWALVLAFLTGLGFLLGGLLAWFAHDVSRAMGLEGAILVHGETFLRVLGVGMFARAIWAGCLNILASVGLTSWNLWAAILVMVTNTFLNMLFLGYGGFMTSLGTQGVALATILSWVVVSAALLTVLSWKLHWLPSLRDVRLGLRHQLSPLLRIGLPSAVEPISFQLFLVALGSQVVRLGEIPLTARVYAANLANVPVIFSYGAGFAAQILVAHMVGAGRIADADRSLRKALLWGGLFTTAATVAVAATAPWTLQLFTHSRPVLELGCLLLWIDACLQPAKCGNIALTFSLRASGDSRFPAVMGTSLMWTVGLGGSMFLCFGMEWGVVGIWAGMVIDEWVRALVNWRRWSTGGWKDKAVVSRRKSTGIAGGEGPDEESVPAPA